MTTDTSIPKQELLTKLLKMTASDNDGEALTAIRKANALLRTAGWDWDKLIEGKIRIIEDPFKNIGTPATKCAASNSGSYAPSRPSPPPPPPKVTTWPLGIQVNRYSGFCYCCGNEVMANDGLIFKPITHNANASSDWKIACTSCNGTNTVRGAHVPTYPAARQRIRTGKRGTKPFVSDLS